MPRIFSNCSWFRLRKQIAADKLAVAERRVADAVLGMEHKARVAFYTYQGRRQTLALQKTILDAQQSSCDLARQQHKAGNISDLDLASEEASFSTAKLEVARTEFAAKADREEVTRLMGLSGPEVDTWQAAEKLPDMPAAETSMQELESLALRQRLDLDAERRQTLVIARSLGLTEQFRLTGIEIGIDVERRDATENYVMIAGPQLTVELPIFDQKQAQIARLQAEYRQGVDRIAALVVGHPLASSRGSRSDRRRTTNGAALSGRSDPPAPASDRAIRKTLQRHAPRRRSLAHRPADGSDGIQGIHRSGSRLLDRQIRIWSGRWEDD